MFGTVSIRLCGRTRKLKYKRLELAVGDRPTLIGDDVMYCDLRDMGIKPLTICDISERMPFKDNSFSVIQGMHCLEHISHTKTDEVLKEWFRILAPGGVLHVDVPNMGYWARRLVHDPNDMYAMVHFYGYQDYGDLNVHRTGFTHSLLEKAFKRAGLVNVIVTDLGAALGADGFKE